MKINIKDKLDEKNITRYELAKRIGVTYPTIDSMYKGTSNSIKLDILESICKELDCLPTDILIFDDKNFEKDMYKRLIDYVYLYHKIEKSKSDTK